MKSRTMNAEISGDDPVGIEAGRWILRLQGDELDLPCTAGGPREHDEAFIQWLTQSPRHLRVFLEIFETYRVLGHMDPQRLISVEALIKSLDADVIRLRTARTAVLKENGSVLQSAAAPSVSYRRGRMAAAAAVAAVLLMSAAWLSHHLRGLNVYSTAIGEQRTCKLADGSFVYLNTDSQVKVRFSDRERRIQLVRGEALFVVERDSLRPFIVSTEDAHIRALGTQFNVRRRAELTDVAVVEGTVQVTVVRPSDNGSLTESPTAADANGNATDIARLSAGEEARVASHRVARRADANVENALAWRTRRLTFTEAPLAEVAAEFNRYNQRKIRVEGNAGKAKRLTGIFDADRPGALVLYALKDESLIVEPKGDEWIIRMR